MGIGADQVDKTTLWKLSAQIEGWIDANTPKDKRRMSVAEFDELAKRLE